MEQSAEAVASSAARLCSGTPSRRPGDLQGSIPLGEDETWELVGSVDRSYRREECSCTQGPTVAATSGCPVADKQEGMRVAEARWESSFAGAHMQSSLQEIGKQ